MVHGVNILGRYLGRVPVNQKLVINNYNNYSQRPLPFIMGGNAGYPYCNDYYWGRDPYSSYYLTAGLFSFGLMLGNLGLGGLFGAVKKLFSKPNKHRNTTPTNTSTISSGNPATPSVKENPVKATQPQPQVVATEQNIVNQDLTLAQNVNEQNPKKDVNYYKNIVKNAQKEMNKQNNPWDLQEKIDDSYCKLIDMNSDIQTIADEYNLNHASFTNNEYAKQIKQQKENIKNFDSALKTAQNALNIAQTRYNNALYDVSQAEKELAGINNKIDDLNQRLEKEYSMATTDNYYNEELAKLNEEKSKAEQEIIAKKEILQKINDNELTLAKENKNTAQKNLDDAKTELSQMETNRKTALEKKDELEKILAQKDELQKSIDKKIEDRKKMTEEMQNKAKNSKESEAKKNQKAHDKSDKGKASFIIYEKQQSKLQDNRLNQ